MEAKFLEVNKTHDLEEAEQILLENFTVSKNSHAARRQHYYDTFDQRLYRNNFILQAEKQKYSLINLKNNHPEEHHTVKGKKLPAFWYEFPDGRLRDKLKELLDIRALVHMTTIEKTETELKVLNKDDKTVVTISLSRVYSPESGEKIPIKYEISVNPVRGYPEEFGNVLSVLSNAKIGNVSQNHVRSILEKKVKEKGIYSSKLDIELSPDMSGVEAAKVIYSDLLQTVRQNENGIISDIDTEFLHDFRVAVRRIRSALALIKGVYPKEDVKMFKKDFSKLGKKTNRLRDIDVYLLNKNRYINMLSREQGKGLEPVFKELMEERKSEQKKLASFLQTDTYRRTINKFENYIKTSNGNSDSPNSNIKIITLAKEFIWKKYLQIMTKGSMINDKSPDPDLHELRIECKKLRYLLEFFSSLFPKKEMSNIIKQLKVLQDNLGDFNDLYVQQKDLKKFIENNAHNSKDAQMVSVSVGGLIAVLHQKQKVTRNEFSKSFSSLHSSEYEKLFEDLFYPEDNT